MLARLSERGIALAVVSNKIESAVISLCRQYFEGIDIALGDREGRRKKPYPDALFEALRRLGLAPEEAVYIGDSEVDVETAKNAGMDCISVTWGFRDTDALKRAWNVTDNTDLFAENGFSSGEITAYFASSPKEVEKILKIADE
jgi:phosphoglycolate phosphatase-like HAD superfamily hydrolase